MKTIARMLLGILLLGGTAFADEPAVINAPANAWDNFKRVINTVEPSADAIFDVRSGDVRFGSSIRLYTFEKIHPVKYLDLRGGFFETKGLYATLSLALDRLTGNELLKHVHVGVPGGYDWDNHQGVYGAVAGAKLEF